VESTVFQLVLSALLGLAIGSFLNVVVYRLPRGLSVSEPRRSFCPSCQTEISWRDNLPVLSWLLLGGRCRHCRQPISGQYPIVELVTAIVFVAVFDAVFIGRSAALTTGRTEDFALLAGYWVLFASLLANAVMDVEEYAIDVYVTYVAMVAGVAARAVWTAILPPSAIAVPDGRVGITAAAVGAAWLITAWIGHRRAARTADACAEAPDEASSEARSGGPGPEAADAAVEAPKAGDSDQPEANPPSQVQYRPFSPISVIALAGVLVAICAGVVLDAPRLASFGDMSFPLRAIVTLLTLTLVLTLAAMQPRPADAEILSVLEDERPRARRVALSELAWLTPSIMSGAATWLILDWTDFAGLPSGAWQSRLLIGGLDGLGGLMAGAVLGWTVRILFTLAFGKEALGTGDIFVLAAIGAAGGFWMALIAFFASALLALVGMPALLMKKSGRVIPFGPWLALGALVALWVYSPVMGAVMPGLAEIWTLISGGEGVEYLP